MRRYRNVVLLLLVLIVTGLEGCARGTSTPSARTPTPRATATGTPTATPTPRRAVPPTSTGQPTSTPTPTPRPPTPTPTLQQLLEQYPQLAALLNNPVVDARYKELLIAYEEGGDTAALGLARERGLLTPEGEIRMALLLDTEEHAGTVARLEGMGIRVLNASGNRIEIAIPPELLITGAGEPGALLNQISALEHVVDLQTPG